jgi:hypothetical protein
MVFIGCTKCGSFCHFTCYFDHHVRFACHKPGCVHNDSFWVHERVHYNESMRPYLCFSDDGVGEWVVSPIMCMEPFIVYKEKIQPDWSLRLTIWKPGPVPGHPGFTAEAFIPRTRRPKKRYDPPLPPGRVERKVHHHI